MNLIAKVASFDKLDKAYALIRQARTRYHFNSCHWGEFRKWPVTRCGLRLALQGVHSLLQIRAVKAGHNWEQNWQEYIMGAYAKTA